MNANLLSLSKNTIFKNGVADFIDEIYFEECAPLKINS
jgi:hypothetical protein